MTKIVFCLRRAAGLSREAFQTYWREQHAPLVAARAPLLGIRRYVQSHTLDERQFAAVARARQSPEAYDGVAEIWFEDSDEGTPAQRLQAARELLVDEQRFIDLPRSAIFYVQEHQVL